jgi:pSer/pThr/pTyr-binding forkhead associated (FHA) protein
MYKLVISDDEGKTTTVPLVRDEITIGRKEGNTIRLTDRNVSRRHAKLQKQNGGYVLQDLGSYNGTVINGTRLSDQRALKMGDQIVIGDYKLNIVEESAAQVAPAATPAANAAAAVVETYEAPAQSGGHHPQATMPAIPSAIGVPPPVTIVVPEHVKKLQLVFMAPAGTPGPFTMNKLPILLGRSEIADVSLPFSSISREHAKITLDGDQLVVEDLGSSNGVVVNGERVKKHPIKAGDQITMGVVECKVAKVGEAVPALVPMASAAIANEPEVAAPAKKSSVGMLVGVGVLVAVLGGGGAVVAMRGSTPTNTSIAQNSTVVTGSDPAPNTANSGSSAANAAQPAAQPAANPQAAPTGDPPTQPANNGAEPANPVANNAAPTQTQDTPPENNPQQNTGSQAVAQNDPPTARTSESSGRPRVRPSNTEPSNGGSSQTATVAPTTVRNTSPSTNPTATTGAATAPAGTQNVAQCLLANDFQCVVGALRNRAGTEVEFNQLVTAYKGLHNQAAAEQTMRRYLSRFPDGRYAERYRDMLNQ